jgi:hypothetical protein
MINFGFGKTTAGIPTTDIVISSVPVPSGDKKYGITGTGFWRNWGVVTTVNASFRNDSTLIQQVTVAVTDYRQQGIQALGGIAGTVGGLLSLTATQPQVKLPLGISVTNLLNEFPEGCVSTDKKIARDGDITCKNLKLDGTEDFTADISITKVPDDALPASIMDKPFYSSNFFYSACRNLTITLKPAGSQNTQNRQPVFATLVVADPMHVQTLRFPQKGSITVGASCGANSVAQDANLPTAFDYLNALATQAKAVKQNLGEKSGVSTPTAGSPKPATGPSKPATEK